MAVRIREVFVEAVGDDFAQLSGQWLSGERVAQHVAAASRIWAYAAPDQEAVNALAKDLPVPAGERLIGLSPGANPGWEQADRDAVATLAGGAEEADLVGIFLAVQAPPCAFPQKAGENGGCPGKCGGCSAIK